MKLRNTGQFGKLPGFQQLNAAVLIVSVLLIANSSLAETRHDAGSLDYSGDVNGSVTFGTAECVALDNEVPEFTAPRQPDSGEDSEGPMLTYNGCC